MIRRALALLAAAALAQCGSDDPPPPPPITTGARCSAPAQCYPGVDRDAGVIPGQVICLTKVTDGYCTHTCTTDADCVTISGDYRIGHVEVCSPFENTTDTYCFLSCEQADLADAGVANANAYCSQYAATGITCRSSGGGSGNRQICMP